MAVQLFKTLLNHNPLIIIPAKWNIAIVWLFRTGQTNEKSPHRESGLKWEAKDSSKLIGNKDHALRGYHRRWPGFGKSG